MANVEFCTFFFFFFLSDFLSKSYPSSEFDTIDRCRDDLVGYLVYPIRIWVYVTFRRCCQRSRELSPIYLIFIYRYYGFSCVCVLQIKKWRWFFLSPFICPSFVPLFYITQDYYIRHLCKYASELRELLLFSKKYIIYRRVKEGMEGKGEKNVTKVFIFIVRNSIVTNRSRRFALFI